MLLIFRNIILVWSCLFSINAFAYSISEFVEDVKSVGGEISDAWKALVCNNTWCFAPGISVYDCSKENGNIAACSSENHCYYSYAENQCKPNGAFPDDSTADQKYAYSLEFLNTWPAGYYRVSGSIYYSSGRAYCRLTQVMYVAIGSPFITEIADFPPNGRVGDICESANLEFIAKVYFHVLGRAPSEAEIADAMIYLGGGLAQTQNHSIDELQYKIHVDTIYSEIWNRKPISAEYSAGIYEVSSLGYNYLKTKTQVRYIYSLIWGREPTSEELNVGFQQIATNGFIKTMQLNSDLRAAMLVIVTGIILQ